MKNFTKQNFKTNPLWIRLIIMAFMLLIGTGSVLGKTIYFKANGSNNWGDSNAWFFGHFWNNSTSKDVKFTSMGDGMYYCDVPSGMTSIS